MQRHYHSCAISCADTSSCGPSSSSSSSTSLSLPFAAKTPALFINASSALNYCNINDVCFTHQRHIHASSAPSSNQGTTKHKRSQKDFFTPSPFARSPRINVSDKFAIFRELIEGADNIYGIRRYLLISRSEEEDARYYADNENYSPSTTTNIIASLNANRNVLFGAKLHSSIPSPPSSTNSINNMNNNDTFDIDDGDDYISNYLAACGSLLEVAKIDASINGQQVQALATLNGLCSWVCECLEKDGEGSAVLKGLMYGETVESPVMDAILHDADGTKDADESKKLPIGKRAKQRIESSYESFTSLATKDESDRSSMLEAVRAIATGHPRPGHTVVGAGTYRDGRRGWVALAREYSHLAINPNALALDASYVRRRGLEEVALYKSREGEVTAIEHLAHTQPEYLREAGGAMARIFFV